MLTVKQSIFRNTTWEELKAHADNGTLNCVLTSGDAVYVTLKNGEEVTFIFTQDAHGNGYFISENCLQDEHCMNEAPTNKGGWQRSEMRRYLNEEVIALLPDDLAAVIKPTLIVQIVDGKRVECEDRLFIPSATQIFGNGGYSAREPEDSQLDIFKTERSRVKECGNYGTSWWWLRSASANYSFRSVYSDGYGRNNYAGSSGGVALGFSI